MKLIDAVILTKVAIRVLLISLFVVIIAYFAYTNLFTQKPTPTQIFSPDLGCGTIDTSVVPNIPLKLPDEIAVPAPSTLNIDIPPLLFVYRIPPASETFATKSKAQQLAKTLGFNPYGYTKPDPITMLWSDQNKGRILKVRTKDLSFEYYHTPEHLPNLPNLELPPIPKSKNLALNLLSSLGIITKDYQEGKIHVFPVYFKGTVPHETSALIQAHAIEVDIQPRIIAFAYPKKILKLKKLTHPIDFKQYATQKTDIIYHGYITQDFPHQGPTRIFIRSIHNDLLKDTLRITHIPVRYNLPPCGTYRTLGVSEALKLIQNKKASVAFVKIKGGDSINPDYKAIPQITNVSIDSIKILYLYDDKKNHLIFPIYYLSGEAVFADGKSGTLGFYTPAIEVGAAPSASPSLH